jgi:hypothetical protein
MLPTHLSRHQNQFAALGAFSMVTLLMAGPGFAGKVQTNPFGWDPQVSEMPLEIFVDEDNLSIHFDMQFIAAYSKTLCSLRQTWKPDPKEAWYSPPNLVHYRQYETLVWDVLKEQKSILKQIQFSNYTLEPNALFLNYTLILENGRKISIVEAPKHDAHYGAPRLMRNLTVTGLSEGEQIRLRLSDSFQPGFWRLSGNGEMRQEKGVFTLFISQDGYSQALAIWSQENNAKDDRLEGRIP